MYFYKTNLIVVFFIYQYDVFTCFFNFFQFFWLHAIITNQCINRINITVITNDLKVAYTLSENENISLIILGGMKHKDSFDIYGPTAVDILKSLNANKYFIIFIINFFFTAG